MTNTDSYTWIKASRVGSNVRVTVSVHSKYSQNNGLYELVVSEEKAQNALFGMGETILRNRSRYLSVDSHNTYRSTDTLFASEDAAKLAETMVNTTKWDDEPTPTVIKGIRFVNDVPTSAPKVDDTPAVMDGGYQPGSNPVSIFDAGYVPEGGWQSDGHPMGD